MLTRKDLLLQGIRVQDDQQQDEAMALPPSLNGKPAGKKKKHGLFSPALFKESLHANRLGLAIVSAGNALIMIIIIMILSTLNINSTSSALKDLFSNADTETTIKSSAIGLYSGMYNTAYAYDTYQDSEKTINGINAKAVATVNDTDIAAQIDLAKTGFNTIYTISTGDEEVKNSTAKNQTMQLVKTKIETDSAIADDLKPVYIQACSDFFDAYIKDKSAKTKTLLIRSLPVTISSAMAEKQKLAPEKKEQVLALYQGMFDRVFIKSEDITKVSPEITYDVLPILADDLTGRFVKDTSDVLKAEYLRDADRYLADKTIEDKLLSSRCQEYVVALLEENAYYQYLPDFTVPYVTSDRGYPIRYVGTGKYADNGNEIMQAIEVKTYNPSVYVKITGDMGTTANMAQKMHKEVITGKPYTDAEIATAKEDASKNILAMKNQVNDFMKDFITRDANLKNTYFDGENIIDSAVANRVVRFVSSAAEKMIIERYNKNSEVKVSSIDEITALNYAMDGKRMLHTVEGYASSGIASYKTHLQTAIDKGYSKEDAELVATVTGSLGVIDQLPSKVDDSLVEMGGMNTYGIMVGVVTFGIAALLIPMVYTILLSNNLIANKVETGSLAFTLSTPTTRGSFVFTESLYLLFSEAVMGLSVLAAALLSQLVGVAMGGTDLTTSLPIKDLCYYSLGNFMVTVAVSGICFLSSCYFNKSNRAIAGGGGITIFFYICSILGLFGTKAIPATVRINSMSFFNYCTIDSLFDAMAVMDGNWMKYGIKLSVLAIIALVTYLLGDLVFTKKDLPL